MVGNIPLQLHPLGTLQIEQPCQFLCSGLFFGTCSPCLEWQNISPALPIMELLPLPESSDTDQNEQAKECARKRKRQSNGKPFK